MILEPLKDYGRDAVSCWNRFWFTPADSRLPSLLRILVGGMVLYTHLVWSISLESFALADGLIPEAYVRGEVGDSKFFWSHLFGIESAATLWTVHIIALIIFAMFALGLFTRVTSILSFLLVVSYGNRLAPGQFGLDQINAFATMYLAVGPCGRYFSIDSWIRKKRGIELPLTSTSANISLRLIQIHMCIVYLFAGLAKLQGETWVTGNAIWGAFASYEYQTLDMTWTADNLFLINVFTFGTILFELSYCALIWNRFCRPWLLLSAVAMHLGIGICMGMMTFGLIMIFANMAFLPPKWIDQLRGFLRKETGQGGTAESAA